MLGTWNFWWILEASWFVSLPWSVIDWWIHNPNESPKTEFFTASSKPMIFATSVAGFWDRFPFNKDVVFTAKMWKLLYWGCLKFQEDLSKSPISMLHFHSKTPWDSRCKPSTTSRIVGERSPDGRWDHKRGRLQDELAMRPTLLFFQRP